MPTDYSLLNYFTVNDAERCTAHIIDLLISTVISHSSNVVFDILDQIINDVCVSPSDCKLPRHTVSEKTFLAWKDKFPWLYKIEKDGITYLLCSYCKSASRDKKNTSVWGHDGSISSILQLPDTMKVLNILYS